MIYEKIRGKFNCPKCGNKMKEFTNYGTFSESFISGNIPYDCLNCNCIINVTTRRNEKIFFTGLFIGIILLIVGWVIIS